jgi:hypothetical protein
MLSVILALLWGAESPQAQGQMTNLDTLGGEHSLDHRINGRGQVVGSGFTADGELHVFL